MIWMNDCVILDQDFSILDICKIPPAFDELRIPKQPEKYQGDEEEKDLKLRGVDIVDWYQESLLNTWAS